MNSLIRYCTWRSLHTVLQSQVPSELIWNKEINSCPLQLAYAHPTLIAVPFVLQSKYSSLASIIITVLVIHLSQPFVMSRLTRQRVFLVELPSANLTRMCLMNCFVVASGAQNLHVWLGAELAGNWSGKPSYPPAYRTWNKEVIQSDLDESFQ
jgi:hypothetical protein